jgi:hypothetical protein
MVRSGKRELKNLTHPHHHAEAAERSSRGEAETNWKREALEGRRRTKNQDTPQKDTEEKGGTATDVIVPEANGQPGGEASQDSPIRRDPEQKASEDEERQPHEVKIIEHASPDQPSDVLTEEPREGQHI